ncbi:ribonuclease P protein component 4 [Methanogenium organophilum]|uniref:ribonuclease P protein component 4 n=1 Tax=Methanogenium organophilum TaxID=2199 RepID=UPI003898DA1B
MGGKRRQQRSRRPIAKERIEILFTEAEIAARDDPDRAREYIRRARRIAMREKVAIPPVWKRKFCRNCSSFLIPGINARIRIHQNRVIITCQICGRQWRCPVGRRYHR